MRAENVCVRTSAASNVLPSTEFGYPNSLVRGQPLIPREKGELDLRELLLIAAGTLLGSCLGVTMMCLFQINKDCRVKRKEDTDYEKEKH